MGETITAIRPYDWRQGDYGMREEGFEIETTAQIITLAIDAEQSCCENWGYFLSEDDPAKFVGAELRGVRITDTNRTSRRFQRDRDDTCDENMVCLDEGDTLFVDIETDRGPLQFVAYNAHNGYYGHEARVSSKQLTHEVQL
jgi:hypothetical protein